LQALYSYEVTDRIFINRNYILREWDDQELMDDEENFKTYWTYPLSYGIIIKSRVVEELDISENKIIFISDQIDETQWGAGVCAIPEFYAGQSSGFHSGSWMHLIYLGNTSITPYESADHSFRQTAYIYRNILSSNPIIPIVLQVRPASF